MLDPSDGDRAMHEVLAEALRPELAGWGLEEQTDALVAIVAAFFRKGYNMAPLFAVLEQANCELELDPRDHDDWAAP